MSEREVRAEEKRVPTNEEREPPADVTDDHTDDAYQIFLDYLDTGAYGRVGTFQSGNSRCEAFLKSERNQEGDVQIVAPNGLTFRIWQGRPGIWVMIMEAAPTR